MTVSDELKAERPCGDDLAVHVNAAKVNCGYVYEVAWNPAVVAIMEQIVALADQALAILVTE